jgi:hypothetical protein
MIDDADAFVSSARQYADAIKFEHLKVPTMVYCITPTTQSIISKSDLLKDFFADTFWITPLKNKDIKEIILKSIDKFSADSSNPPFDGPATDKVVEYSLGLPGAATRLSLLCLRNAYQTGIKKIDKSIVEHVASNEGYDTSLQLLHQEIKLEGTKYKVVIEILTQYYVRGGGIERTIIIKFSDMAASTLSYHLKDLINDGILKQERIGDFTFIEARKL